MQNQSVLTAAELREVETLVLAAIDASLVLGVTIGLLIGLLVPSAIDSARSALAVCRGWWQGRRRCPR